MHQQCTITSGSVRGEVHFQEKVMLHLKSPKQEMLIWPQVFHLFDCVCARCCQEQEKKKERERRALALVLWSADSLFSDSLQFFFVNAPESDLSAEGSRVPLTGCSSTPAVFSSSHRYRGERVNERDREGSGCCYSMYAEGVINLACASCYETLSLWTKGICLAVSLSTPLLGLGLL